MVKPYPQKWPRNLDFLTPLSLQTALDPKLELYYCGAEVSILEGEKTPPEKIKTDLGGSIKIDRISRNKIQVSYGDPRPRSDHVFTQKEILDEIRTATEIPEAVIKKRHVREVVPKAVEDLKPLQGTEYIYYQQTAQGNFMPKLKRALNLDLRNPYNFIRNDLMTHGLVSPKDKVLRRIRSTLKTDWILGDKAGYMELKEPIESLQLPQALSGRKWWQDIGIVAPFQGRIDSMLFRGQIYHLSKRKWLIAV